jgi:hypothetical protein
MKAQTDRYYRKSLQHSPDGNAFQDYDLYSGINIHPLPSPGIHNMTLAIKTSWALQTIIGLFSLRLWTVSFKRTGDF